MNCDDCIHKAIRNNEILVCSIWGDLIESLGKIITETCLFKENEMEGERNNVKQSKSNEDINLRRRL
jgi:hypothetical protein